MMLTPTEWALLLIPNLLTTAAYFYIPHRLRVKASTGIHLSGDNAFLFESFIKVCGLHHLLHIPFMYMMWIEWMIIEAFVLAVVSMFAAVKLEL